MGNGHWSCAYTVIGKRHSLLWKHSLSPLAENKMQSHGRRVYIYCKYTGWEILCHCGPQSERKDIIWSLGLYSHLYQTTSCEGPQRDVTRFPSTDRSNNRPFGPEASLHGSLLVAHFSCPLTSAAILVMTLYFRFFFISFPSESGNWQLEHQISVAHELQEHGRLLLFFLSTYVKWSHKNKLYHRCCVSTPDGSLSKRAETIDPFTTTILIITD